MTNIVKTILDIPENHDEENERDFNQSMLKECDETEKENEFNMEQEEQDDIK